MYNTSFLFRALALAILAGSLSLPAAARDVPAIKRKLSLPPSANLTYAIRASLSGLTVSGDAKQQWRAADGKYTLTTETSAMLVGKILTAKSEGGVDEYGLAPASFTEKRFRKDPATATFDRQAREISFSESSETYPLRGGEQDRSSVIWQLISIARASREKFKPGSEWTFFVAGQYDAEPWVFKVGKTESIGTPLGDLDAVHIAKVQARDAKGQQLDIWLAPSHEWYPARLRITEESGDMIEQSLVSIGKLAP
ncbi:hypothetical protein BH11PSE11_BH11PSE11_28780 [soil metagenome]